MVGRIVVIAFLGAGAAIGWFLPTRHSPAISRSEITLEKSSDGQFYVDADVNGHTTHFLVDTGASAIALSEADAKAAGISVNPSGYELVGDGASGIVRGQHVKIGRLELGAIRQSDVDGLVVPGTTVSLLGQPFLDKMDEIVISRNEMRLHYSDSASSQ
jgi:aspartyl protease family protein